MTLKNGTNLGLLVDGAIGEQHYSELMRQWRGLDALVQPRVLSSVLATPPTTPAEGDCYIVAASPTGAWANKATQITRWSGTAWEFYVPRNGWRLRDFNAGSFKWFNGTAWVNESSGGGGGGDIIATLVNAEVSITDAVTLDSTAFGKMHVCTGTSDDYTVILPAALGNAGKVIGFRMSNALTKIVTIDGNLAEQIDGALSRLLWANEGAVLLCDGIGWTKIAGKSIPMTVELTRSASQSIAANTVTNVIMTAKTVDNCNIGDVSTGRITFKRAGTYLVRNKGVFDSATLGSKSVRLDVNGSNADSTGSFADGRVADKTSPMNLAAGAYITLALYNQAAADAARSIIMSATEITQW